MNSGAATALRALDDVEHAVPPVSRYLVGEIVADAAVFGKPLWVQEKSCMGVQENFCVVLARSLLYPWGSSGIRG